MEPEEESGDIIKLFIILRTFKHPSICPLYRFSNVDADNFPHTVSCSSV
jgi:hypothetical protein